MLTPLFAAPLRHTLAISDYAMMAPRHFFAPAIAYTDADVVMLKMILIISCSSPMLFAIYSYAADICFGAAMPSWRAMLAHGLRHYIILLPLIISPLLICRLLILLR